MEQKVLMVCLGNICRSPMAHGLLEHKVKELGLSVLVDSAGTGAYHVGEAPDPRSIQKMQQYGVNISHQRARQFIADDLEVFDHIFAMDTNNYRNIINLSQGDADNVRLMMDLAYPGEDMSVPDPYYGGEDGFENVYRLLDEATDRLIELLK